MKKLVLLLAIFMASNFSFAQNGWQEKFESNLEPVLESRFEGGKNAFLRQFYTAIKYPAEARISCRVGQLLVEVTISAQGEIQLIDFKNRLEKGVEEEVTATLSKTKGYWKPAGDASVLRFSVVFKMEDIPAIDGDLKVMAYGARGNAGCDETAGIEKLLNQAIEKGKTAKALEYCEELLRRDPFSAKYHEIYERLK